MKKRFRVADMHCSACVMRLEGIEDDLPGVRRVEASYQRQHVDVEWDERRVSEDEIVAEITRLGYTVG